MNLVVPFGFYGWGNIGDESTLQGFARLAHGYNSNLHVRVASRNVSHTALVEPSLKYFKAVGRDPRRWWAKRRSDGAVFVGGTPIMDLLGNWPLSEVTPLVSSAHSRGKPVAFVGIGTERLQRETSRRKLREVFAPRVAHWSVRSERDKERLTESGVRPESITVAADLAWLLDPVTTDFGKQYLRQLGLPENATFIGVNINSEEFMLQQEPRLFEKLGHLLDVLVKQHGLRVLFLCNEVREDDMFDKATSIKILSSMKEKKSAFLTPNEYFTPQQMLSLIGCCQATISSRYHFCIFSALQKVPCVAIERCDKVADLCWDMQWQYGTSVSNVNVTDLSGAFAEIERRRTELQIQLVNCMRSMKERALRNRTALDAVM